MIFLDKRVRAKPFLCAILCFIGICIVSNIFSEDMSYEFGDTLTIICALLFAFQFICYEKMTKKYNAVNFLIVQFASIGVISLTLGFIFDFDTLSNISRAGLLTALPRLLFLGFVSTGAAYYVQYIVQANISVNSAALISCTESAFAVVFAILTGHDPFSFTLIIGSVFIIAAMTINSWKRSAVRGGAADSS
jgi:drug/metabolite transporter (DMT)-like permease